jgi:cytidylate kinase
MVNLSKHHHYRYRLVTVEDLNKLRDVGQLVYEGKDIHMIVYTHSYVSIYIYTNRFMYTYIQINKIIKMR